MRRSELVDAIREEGERIQWSASDMAAELDRRTNSLLTRALVFAALANAVLTGLLAIVAIVSVLRT